MKLERRKINSKWEELWEWQRVGINETEKGRTVEKKHKVGGSFKRL